MKSKKLKLGIIGGGPNSWIGHVHRIASRFDDKYILVAGVFSRNSKKSISFGKNLGIDPQRCYSNYSEMADKENKLRNKIDVVAIMTPPGSHQKIAEKFIDKNEQKQESDKVGTETGHPIPANSNANPIKPNTKL